MVSEADTCKNNHTKISWNQADPPGAAGAPGVDGADGAFCPINKNCTKINDKNQIDIIKNCGRLVSRFSKS